MTFAPRAIVVPVSHAIEEARVVGAAVEIAKRFDASLTLLYVSEAPHQIVAIVPGASVDGDLTLDRAQAERELDALVAAVRDAGFKHVERAVSVAPTIAQGIVAWVRRQGADLIVMGTHGRTGVARLVTGSYAEDVLKLAPCPVITIHLP